MDNDDLPVGRVLSRREILTLFGAAGVSLLAGCASSDSPTTGPNAAASTSVPSPTAAQAAASPVVNATQAPGTTSIALPTCVVRPEQTEGPFFVDEKLNRSDIRSNPSDNVLSEGILFELTFRVSQVGTDGCLPLANAQVDIWHCDSQGIYSDVENAVGQQFLRGYQLTDAEGLAQFTTIYPGWYPGRAPHIHFKIRGTEASGGYEFTSQLYFDDTTNATIYGQAPYAARGQGFLVNARDGIFASGGDQLTLSVKEASGGYTATFEIGMQM